ncbi:MAG: copper chaperone PCu(A)C [Betaproteobacteria bacterium]|nr:MAG: copper chaperone PCu(A)C [Betaproteobacteria bacterium]
MKKILISALLGFTASFAGASFAQDFKVGNINIEHPWARATPGAVKNSAAFMVFDNKGAADKLLSVTGDVAREIQIHSMVREAGVMRMREIKSLDIPANGKAELKPGGFHIMLIGLKDGLKDGHKFPLKLKFEKAGEVTVTVVAEKATHDHSGHKH